jgi:hypothetical protein
MINLSVTKIIFDSLVTQDGNVNLSGVKSYVLLSYLHVLSDPDAKIIDKIWDIFGLKIN